MARPIKPYEVTIPRNKERMLIALENHLGIVYQACKEAGICKRTHYNYYKSDPEYAAAVDDIMDSQIDVVEHSLIHKQIIEDANPVSTIFYLKNKGRKRGYGPDEVRHVHNTIDAKDVCLKFLVRAIEAGMTLEEAREALELTQMDGVPASEKSAAIKLLTA